MRHRIRAAGLLIDEDRILLVNENDGGKSYWVPPGGGFEAKDGNTRNTVKREVFEVRNITQAKWFSASELYSIKVFPQELKTLLWEKLENKDLSIVHLGYF
mgnify:CR=1 FL=1